MSSGLNFLFFVDRRLWEEHRDGISSVHLHGLFGTNAQFHVVALEQPSELFISRIADARNRRSTQTGTANRSFNSHTISSNSYPIPQAPFSTLFVSTLKAYFLECSEVSTSFNANPLPDTKVWIHRYIGFSFINLLFFQFYADLYHLANDHFQPNSQEKQNAMDAVLRDNVVQILKAIRPLSFCWKSVSLIYVPNLPRSI